MKFIDARLESNTPPKILITQRAALSLAHLLMEYTQMDIPCMDIQTPHGTVTICMPEREWQSLKNNG